jgi:mRNA interferase MazF
VVLAATKPTGLNEHYVVAMMTSHLGGLSFPSDVVLQEWQKAGLPKPTLVRLAKVVTIDRVLVRRKLGRLRASDQKIVKKKFRELFSRLYNRRE